jgi:hypothetical protein
MPIQQEHKRAPEATEVSLSSLKKEQQRRNAHSGEGSSSFQTPDKESQCRVTAARNTNDFNETVFREIIGDFCIEEKQVQTVSGR